jgi:uncharacterized membrane protein
LIRLQPLEHFVRSRKRMSPSRKRLLKDLLAVPLGVAVIFIGVQHFIRPEVFDAIVPAYLGWPRLWTLSSGALEVLLGAGMCVSATRRWSARLFFYLVLLMSLANLNMWWNDLEFDGVRLSQTQHLIRLGVQVLLLLTLLWLSREDEGATPAKSA